MWIIRYLRDGISGYIRGHAIAACLTTIGAGALVIAVVSFLLTNGPAFIALWAFLFLSGVLVVNSILQTKQYRRTFVTVTPGVSREQQQELEWAQQLRSGDLYSWSFLRVEASVDLLTIYNWTAPTVLFNFHLWDAMTCPIRIGDKVSGEVWAESDGRLGGMPTKPTINNGQEVPLSLSRGQGETYTLRWDITPELRDRWIINRVGSEIRFELKRLYISMDILDPIDRVSVIGTRRLQIPDVIGARLVRTEDWP